MGAVSIWHILFLLIVTGVLAIPALMPLWVKPSGPNRFWTPGAAAIIWVGIRRLYAELRHRDRPRQAI
jgi:hypothetical protein